MRIFIFIFTFMLSTTIVASPRHQKEVAPREIAPIVSTDWLESNLSDSNLVVLDVRAESDYLAGHIPGAINEPFVVPFSAWIVMDGDLLLELPEDEDILATIGNLGIDQTSKVVVVSAPAPNEPPHYGMAAATRVADTLIYAGLKNISILNGGFGKWSAESKPTSQEETIPTPVSYDGNFNSRMFVSQSYVLMNAWRAQLVDARDAEIYFGAALEPFASKPGHIYSAVSLPAPWAFAAADGDSIEFKDFEILKQMAKGVLGHRTSKKSEIIVYCGVGGYSSVWWYLLREVLGYKNVKFYDGSAQEWALHYDLVPYRWDK